jgi:hypothetical protein
MSSDIPDSEDIVVPTKASYTAPTTVSGFGWGKIRVALILLAFIVFVLSDVFVDRILSDNLGRYVDGSTVTAQGTCTQAVVISIGYILISVLVENGFI